MVNFIILNRCQKILLNSKSVVKNNADLGIITDPDVDRLAFVCEDVVVFGEEHTLVAYSDYYLGLYKGPTVSI